MERILLIEDDRYLSMGLQELLEKNGYAVQTADSLEAARTVLICTDIPPAFRSFCLKWGLFQWF